MVACSMILIPNIADAYYAAHMGRFTNRDPVSMRIGMERSLPVEITVGFLSREPATGAAVIADRRYGYPDGFNLYNYVRNAPIGSLDPFGEQFSPLPGTGIYYGMPICNTDPCDDIGIGDIIDEAEKRRGSRGPGDMSSQHCWAACMFGAKGAGVGGVGAAIIETGAEVITDINQPDCWDDICDNFKGAGHGFGAAISNECPEDYCDKKCGTHP